MATSRKSDLQRQLRELDEQRARLMAELRASEQEAAPPSDEEDDLAGEGIKFPDGTRDGVDDNERCTFPYEHAEQLLRDAVATGAEDSGAFVLFVITERELNDLIHWLRFTQFTMAYMSLATAGSATA